MHRGAGLTGADNLKVVCVCGEGAAVPVDDSAKHSRLGGGRGYLLGQLVEAGVVAMPPHVPALQHFPQAPRCL